MKNSEEKYELHKLKERERKKAKKQNMTSDPATSSSPNNSFTTKQAFGKATQQELRKIYLKAKEEKEKLYQPFFPVFRYLQKIIYLKLLISFLERPDIPYYKPGRKDTDYCGKIDKNENIY